MVIGASVLRSGLAFTRVHGVDEAPSRTQFASIPPIGRSIFF
nr:MAG TPA: hypothetical protein [Caudoviricetes sp.]